MHAVAGAIAAAELQTRWGYEIALLQASIFKLLAAFDAEAAGSRPGKVLGWAISIAEAAKFREVDVHKNFATHSG